MLVATGIDARLRRGGHPLKREIEAMRERYLKKSTSFLVYLLLSTITSLESPFTLCTYSCNFKPKMDSIVFYQPLTGITKRNLKDAAKIHGSPLPQDKTEEDSGRYFGHFAATNDSRYQISDGSSSSDNLLSGVKTPEIQTGQSEDCSSSMRKHPRKHPLRSIENSELSRGLRAVSNNYAFGTNRDTAIMLSDCDSDVNNPRASSGCQNSYSLRVSRHGRRGISTDDSLEPASGEVPRSVPSSPGQRIGSRRNVSTHKTSPRVTDQQNENNHGNRDKAATSVFRSTSNDLFGILPGSPTEVATDNSIANGDDREASESRVHEDIQDQNTLEKETTSKSILMRMTSNDEEYDLHPGRQGPDFVSRLPKEQRNQYAPLGSRQETLQKKRTRAESEDGLDPKRIRSYLEQRDSIPTSRYPAAVDPEDCQYLVDRLLEKRTRKHSKKSVT